MGIRSVSLLKYVLKLIIIEQTLVPLYSGNIRIVFAALITCSEAASVLRKLQQEKSWLDCKKNDPPRGWWSAGTGPGVSILADSKTWLEQAWSKPRFSPALSRGSNQMISLKEDQRTNLSLEAGGRTWFASTLLRPNCVLRIALGPGIPPTSVWRSSVSLICFWFSLALGPEIIWGTFPSAEFIGWSWFVPQGGRTGPGAVPEVKLFLELSLSGTD